MVLLECTCSFVYSFTFVYSLIFVNSVCELVKYKLVVIRVTFRFMALV